MNELTDFLLDTNLLTKEQIDFIISKSEHKKLKVNSVISQPYKIPNEIAFVTKGIFRVFYFDEEGNEITKFLFDEHIFLVDIENYLTKQPSNDYIQAITNAEILLFKRKSFEELETEIVNWSKVVNQIITKSHLKKFNLVSPMLHETATVRYQNFIKKFPNLTNKIPLSFIASFLGITQQSLSRIRKNLT